MRKQWLVVLGFMLVAGSILAAPKQASAWKEKALSPAEQRELIAVYTYDRCEVRLFVASPIFEPGTIHLVGRSPDGTLSRMSINGSGRIGGTITYKSGKRVENSRDLLDPLPKETPTECVIASQKAGWPIAVRYQLENMYTRDGEYQRRHLQR